LPLRDYTNSKVLYESARRVITGGVHSGVRFQEPHPIYFKRAKGSRIWDVDENEYIDCIVNMGACVLGHGDSKVLDAVAAQLSTGLTAGLESELSVRAAEGISQLVPSAEIVKFSNTGTEAVMHAIQIARGFTGKNRIIKIEGGYDGWYDFTLVSVHPRSEETGPAEAPAAVSGSRGISTAATKETIVIPYNNLGAAETLVRKFAKEAAALIVEPVAFNMGCVLPKEGYLNGLREITECHDVLLIFDEVISGFRMAPGGAQSYYKVTPDLSVFGKAIANGFPVSAVVGKKEIMEITDPKKGKVAFMGTYNASQASLAACDASVRQLADGKVQSHLHRASEILVKGFDEAARAVGVAARMQGIGGKFQVYFTNHEVTDYRSAALSDEEKYAAFQKAMVSRGIYFYHGASFPTHLFHHGVSYAHSDEDLKTILRAAEESLGEMKR
jgi:glutamate-1-semialdehyde 2,1-aminomutase